MKTKKPLSVAIALAGVLAVGAVLAGDPLTYSKSNSDGSTHANGDAQIVIGSDGTWDVRAHVHTKKTGVDGTGFGCAQLSFLDVNMQPFFQVNANKTKGAVFPSGLAEGDDDQHETLFPAVTSKIGAVAFDVQAVNSNGIPRSINELKQFIGDVLHSVGIEKLSDLPLGQAVEKGGVIFQRLK